MNAFATFLDSIGGGSPDHWRSVINVKDPRGLWQRTRAEAARLRQQPNGAAESAAALREFARRWRQKVETGHATATPDRLKTLALLDDIATGFAEAVQPTLGWRLKSPTGSVSPTGADEDDQDIAGGDGEVPTAFHFHELLRADEPPPSAWAPFVVTGKNQHGDTVGAEVLCLEFHLVPSAARQARLHPLAEFSQPAANIDEEFRTAIEQAWRLANQPERFRPRTPLGVWWQVCDLQGNAPTCEQDAPRLSGPSAGGAAFRALAGALRRREPALPLPAVADTDAVCVMAKLAESAGGAAFMPEAVQEVAVKGRAMVRAIREHRDRQGPGHRVGLLDTVAVARLTASDRAAIEAQIKESGLENLVRVLDLGTGR